VAKRIGSMARESAERLPGPHRAGHRSSGEGKIGGTINCAHSLWSEFWWQSFTTKNKRKLLLGFFANHNNEDEKTKSTIFLNRQGMFRCYSII